MRAFPWRAPTGSVLTEHIAVMDLLALADAVLLPQDDLALADGVEVAAVWTVRG